MKYVLRNKNTGRYLKRKGLWVRRMEEAITFEDVSEAREYCQAHQVEDAQAVQQMMPYLWSLLRGSARSTALGS
jgi:hypothetical protein